MKKRLFYIFVFFILFPALCTAGGKRDFLLEDILCYFSGDSAFKDVQAQCNLGPRPPMTKEHALCRKYIVDELEKLGLNVRTDTFKGTYGTGRGVIFHNIIASRQCDQPAGPFIKKQKK